MSDIGLARGTVRLEPYNLSWSALYQVEAKLIQKQLAIKEADIQHVGSTSIPGMVAKPIIDIAIRVTSLDIAEQWKDRLESLGYWYKGVQSDMLDRRFFAKGSDDKRLVYLHVVNETEFDRLIKFRDLLTNNKQAAAEYTNLKVKLAASNADNRANYSKLKNSFIQSILHTSP